MRGADRRLRQRSGALLACAARPWPLLRTRIPFRYPATELLLGGLFVATVLVLRHDAVELVLGLAFVTTLVAVTLTDLEQRLIPNRILLVSAIAGLAIAAVGDPGSCLNGPLPPPGRADSSSSSRLPTHAGWVSAT